jgi:hypothetical protein
MNKLALAAAAILAAAPALAHPAAKTEARIPRMANFLEWVADGDRGLYIQAESGKWYYASTRGPCARLSSATALSFQTAPNGDLDRYGAIRSEGWRCLLSSVTQSGPPPSRKKG